MAKFTQFEKTKMRNKKGSMSLDKNLKFKLTLEVEKLFLKNKLINLVKLLVQKIWSVWLQSNLQKRGFLVRSDKRYIDNLGRIG